MNFGVSWVEGGNTETVNLVGFSLAQLAIYNQSLASVLPGNTVITVLIAA